VVVDNKRIVIAGIGETDSEQELEADSIHRTMTVDA